MTTKEIIKPVLSFDDPQRIGLTYSEYDHKLRICDVVTVGPTPDESFQPKPCDDGKGGEYYNDEWGCIAQSGGEAEALGTRRTPKPEP